MTKEQHEKYLECLVLLSQLTEIPWALDEALISLRDIEQKVFPRKYLSYLS